MIMKEYSMMKIQLSGRNMYELGNVHLGIWDSDGRT